MKRAEFSVSNFRPLDSPGAPLDQAMKFFWTLWTVI